MIDVSLHVEVCSSIFYELPPLCHLRHELVPLEDEDEKKKNSRFIAAIVLAQHSFESWRSNVDDWRIQIIQVKGNGKVQG